MKKFAGYVLPVIFFCLISLSLFAETYIIKAAQPQVISDSLTNIGHATMKIKTSDGIVIYIDPFAPGDYSDSADIILVTHAHGDHNNVSLVKQKPGCTVISYANSNLNGDLQSFTVGNIDIDAVPAYNANHNRNQCVGYVIEFNDIKLYHAGDTGKIPEMADLAQRNLHYALLPVDGIFTMSPEEATESAAMIEAEHSIPMHTEVPPDDYNEENIARFTPPNRILLRNGETIALSSLATSTEGNDLLPLNFELHQNYPNPFNPATKFSFSLPEASFVQLKIFNSAGEEVGLALAENLPAGNHLKQWDAEGLSSGVYFGQISAGKLTATRKFVLMK